MAQNDMHGVHTAFSAHRAPPSADPVRLQSKKKLWGQGTFSAHRAPPATTRHFLHTYFAHYCLFCTSGSTQRRPRSFGWSPFSAGLDLEETIWWTCLMCWLRLYTLEKCFMQYSHTIPVFLGGLICINTPPFWAGFNSLHDTLPHKSVVRTRSLADLVL